MVGKYQGGSQRWVYCGINIYHSKWYKKKFPLKDFFSFINIISSLNINRNKILKEKLKQQKKKNDTVKSEKKMANLIPIT